MKKHYTEVKDYPYSPIKYDDVMIGRENQICNRHTYLFILVNAYAGRVDTRQFLRQYYKQGMMYHGKQINYAFIVTCNETDTKSLIKLKKENQQYKDLLISLHEDTYFNVSMTIYDGFYYALYHCKQSTFICKTDSDSYVNFGYLINYLSTAPSKRFYSGNMAGGKWKHRNETTRIYNVPDDFNGDTDYMYAEGGGFVFSNDLTPYVCIGTKFYSLDMYSEDPLVGKALEYAGYSLIIANDHLKNCTFMSHYIHKAKKKENYIFIHHCRTIEQFSHAFLLYKDRNANDKVCQYVE